MKLLPRNMGIGVLSNIAFLYDGPHGHQQQPSVISPFFAFARKTSLPLSHQEDQLLSAGSRESVRIGIVGGGICGNAVAHALAKRLESNATTKDEYQIVVLEGDPSAPFPNHDDGEEQQGLNSMTSPKWHAAAARNANSIVPGSSMHVFSKKSAVWQIAHDTLEEWYFLAKDWFQSKLPRSPDENSKLPRREDFAITPPYFAVHPWKCLGPSATAEERWTFLRFIKHFLYVSILQGDTAATQRGSYMCQLAKANRDIFLDIVQQMNQKGHNIQYSRGFLALYRDLEAAKHSQETTRKHGEEAHLLTWEEAVRQVPHLNNLPMKPLAVVHRPNEIISSCEQFLRAWTNEIFNLGVRYRHGLVDKVEPIRKKDPTKTRENNAYIYRVTYQDGTTQDFDLLVLAAGVYSPVIATRMGIGQYVPTYPLRGFSLTTFVREEAAAEAGVDDSNPQNNLLPKSFSLDSMYCTSVSPYMARWAGYGEFVGYPPNDKGVLSVGPSILSRYSRCVFPEAEIGIHKEDALRCFRPASPDDLPIVGPIPQMPGLFIHTGHGTLGWTTGLATGHCLAQAIDEFLRESPVSVAVDGGKYYHLPNGMKMERKLLAPDRFVV